MSTTFETGHVKNVANFEQLLSFCTDYGTAYNPAKVSIQLAQLNTLLASAEAALNDVNSKHTAFKIAVNARQAAFADLKKLSTKLVNALAASDATDKTVLDAKSINRKIQGVRAVPLPRKKKEAAPAKKGQALPVALVPPPTSPTPLVFLPNATTTTPVATDDKDKHISASQQSFDQLMSHFSKLIVLLQNEPNYQPNETELQTATLSMLYANMKTTNTNVINTNTRLSNSRIARNEMLYNKKAGLSNIALEVKNYVKSLFGASSAEYKQIGKIYFSK